MEVAETLAKPWARVMACADLTVFQSVAIQPVDPVRFPSIGDLTERWGWSAHEVRKVLVDDPAWSDPTLTGNGDRAARWAAIKESRTSRSGSHGSRKDRARIAHGSHEDATVEPIESATKAHGFNTDHARIAITSLNTRVGSQSTEHRAQSTGETETQDAPVPVAPPEKPKRAKPSPDQPSDSERQAFDDALGAIAEIDHGAALRIDAGTSGALRKSLLSALRRDGDIVTVRRLRYVARSGDGLDLCARVGGPGVGPLLHDPRRANPRTGGPCWAAQLDDKAAAMVATPNGSRDLAHPTDARWRELGWTPTRTAQPPPARPGGRKTEAEIEAEADALLFAHLHGAHDADDYLDAR
jgi:hypothetical protein